MTPERLEQLRQIAGGIDSPKSEWMDELIDEVDRLRRVEAERDEARQRLLTAAGDDLCRLSQEEIKAMSAGTVPIPPKDEFLASCERFHAQVAKEAGVNHSCLTLAQLIAENESLRQRLAEAEAVIGNMPRTTLAAKVGTPPPGPPSPPKGKDQYFA